MAGGDGTKRAGVIVEANGVVETTGLSGHFAEAFDPFIAVMEPPGRTQFECRINTGQRGQLAAI